MSKVSYYQKHRDHILLGLSFLSLPVLYDFFTNTIPLWIDIPLSIVSIFALVYFFRDPEYVSQRSLR